MLICVCCSPKLAPTCLLATILPTRTTLQACILFGLGLIIVTIQLATRLACSQIANASVKGISVSEVCVTVPSVSGG